MDRNNYENYNSSGGMRDRGERYTQRSGEREREREQQRNRAPRENGRQRQPSGRRDDPRGDNYRSNGSRRDQYGDNGPQMQQAYSREDSYNRGYNNNSSNSLVNSNTNLLQSPFQNPYKIDSNASKTTAVIDPNKDRLEAYAKLKSISPVKFYISIIIAIILTAVLAIIGLICLSKNGLATSNIRDVTTGMAQGYLFYCGFLFIAILTGIYAFFKKWNNLLVTYVSFLFVSCLYLAYFTIELVNIKFNTVDIMNTRWKDEFSDEIKSTIQEQLGCCGYYDSDDDVGKSGDCINNDSLRKRFFNDSFEFSPISYGTTLRKRMVPAEGSCAEQMKRVIDKNLPMYIIIFVVLLLLNIAAVVVTILDIKQYSDILRELSTPFA
jgi:hypothetical protein